MFLAVLLVSLTLSTFGLTIRSPQPPQPSPQPSHSKGMTHVALVELGTGCCHQNNATKAAMRAANAAVEWNSIKVRTIIPGSYDAMRLHVQIGVPNPGDVNLDAIASCFPYGTLLPIVVEKGGLLGSSRAGLPADEPVEAHMTVACCCVTVGWGVPVGWDSPAGYLEAEEAEVKRDDETAAFDKQAEASAILNKEAGASALEAVPATTVADETLEPTVASTPSTTPTRAEMTPGSPEMRARAALVQKRWASRVLTPYEAFKLLGDEDAIEVYDVRTSEQAANHEINGCKGTTVLGAKSLPLDDIVSGMVDVPPSELPIILVCSRGPKSLVALDYLAETCPKAVCIEGGITAWDVAKLPTQSVRGQ